MMASGELPKADYSVFADTVWEPDWVYEQLAILKQIENGPPIIEVSAGSLPDDLKNGVPYKTKAGRRFSSIPSFTAFSDGQKTGKRPRQCTYSYKIEPIEKWIRYELLGLNKGDRWPSDVEVVQLFGFSTDESSRAVNMINRFGQSKGRKCDFPLLWEDVRMTRGQAKQFIEDFTDHRPWRSSRCKGCPLQMNHHWLELKTVEPQSFEETCQFDDAMRKPGFFSNKGMKEKAYLHRHAVPLRDANLDADQLMVFGGECAEGCFL